MVTQGKTELKGQTLVYDETDGIARIKDPVCPGQGVLAVMLLDSGSFDFWAGAGARVGRGGWVGERMLASSYNVR